MLVLVVGSSIATLVVDVTIIVVVVVAVQNGRST